MNRRGSFRIFGFAGIDVFLHWSWFLVAALEISQRSRNYSTPVWNAAEYLSLFLIVLLHEFGHALACRSVGGEADQIVLWPLGGIAYVAPPPRPGATLWTIAAGPLVNVVLIAVLRVVMIFGARYGWAYANPDFERFLYAVWYINLGLLIFNLLPVYPLDGGQILRSLLWFVFGRARSLLIASVIGFIGVGALLVVAILQHSVWFVILAVFMFMRCSAALRQAREMARQDLEPPTIDI